MTKYKLIHDGQKLRDIQAEDISPTYPIGYGTVQEWAASLSSWHLFDDLLPNELTFDTCERTIPEWWKQDDH